MRLAADNEKLKTISQNYKIQLDIKQASIMDLSSRVCKVEMIDRKSVISQLNEDEKSRVKNGMYNKGLQDMRLLIEKVLVENIGLKKENDMIKAKQISQESDG